MCPKYRRNDGLLTFGTIMLLKTVEQDIHVHRFAKILARKNRKREEKRICKWAGLPINQSEVSPE